MHSGRFHFLIDGKQLTVSAGDPMLVVRPPTPHSWWNADPENEGVLDFTFTPGGKVEEFFRTIMGLGRVGMSPHACRA